MMWMKKDKEGNSVSIPFKTKSNWMKMLILICREIQGLLHKRRRLILTIEFMKMILNLVILMTLLKMLM